MVRRIDGKGRACSGRQLGDRRVGGEAGEGGLSGRGGERRDLISGKRVRSERGELVEAIDGQWSLC